MGVWRRPPRLSGPAVRREHPPHAHGQGAVAFDVVALGQVDLDIRTGFKDALLIAPKECSFEFVVRGEEKRAVIEQEWEKADRFLSRFEVRVGS